MLLQGPANPAFVVGSSIDVRNWRSTTKHVGRVWKEATVIAVTDNKFFDIKYANGEEENHVHLARIRHSKKDGGAMRMANVHQKHFRQFHFTAGQVSQMAAIYGGAIAFVTCLICFLYWNRGMLTVCRVLIY